MLALPRSIYLTEYEATQLSPGELSFEAGTLLWQKYGVERHVVDVAFPSPRTGGQWELTPAGWAGHIPLTPSLDVLLQPRTPSANLFRLLAYAYRLDEIDFLAGLVASDSVRDVFEQLALLLARAVMAQRRRGLYHAYVPRTEALPYVRGRVVMRPQRSWQPQFDSHFEEHTADVAENQLIAWTLRCIAHSGLCREPVRSVVRRAYHGLAGVSAIPPGATPPAQWQYNPLNRDYAPLHALCRFFLSNSGPGHQLGDRQMLPFLVNMARLYEQVVARWLQQHLPKPWRLNVQERVEAGGKTPLAFTLDMVVYDDTGRAALVLDTKYKPDVTAADIQQVVTYAQLRHCREAVLVYAQEPRRPLDVQVGDIHVRALTFDLEEELEAECSAFIAALGLRTADTFSPNPL